MPDKQKVLKGRDAVNTYRTAHTQLYSGGWYKGLPEAHTPLLNTMLANLNQQGFSSIDEFFDASEQLNIDDMGIEARPIRLNRQDLLLTAGTTQPSLGAVVDQNGVRIDVVEEYGKPEALLFIDGEFISGARPRDHYEMELAVTQCPKKARVFIGGLGLGVVLLYLALSNKATEVIVYELDNRIIQLLKAVFWFQVSYPNFRLQVTQGDALREVTKHGKFDWIFFDLTAPTPTEYIPAIKSALSAKGVYSDWWEINKKLTQEWWR